MKVLHLIATLSLVLLSLKGCHGQNQDNQGEEDIRPSSIYLRENECPDTQCTNDTKNRCEFNVCVFEPDIRGVWNDKEYAFECCLDYCKCTIYYKGYDDNTGRDIVVTKEELEFVEEDDEDEIIRQALGGAFK